MGEGGRETVVMSKDALRQPLCSQTEKHWSRRVSRCRKSWMTRRGGEDGRPGRSRWKAQALRPHLPFFSQSGACPPAPASELPNLVFRFGSANRVSESATTHSCHFKQGVKHEIPQDCTEVIVLYNTCNSIHGKIVTYGYFLASHPLNEARGRIFSSKVEPWHCAN